MRLGAKVKDKLVRRVESVVTGYLYEGEQVVALVTVNKLSPMLDAIVITNARLLGLLSTESGQKAPKIDYFVDELTELRLSARRFGNPTVTAVMKSGDEVGVGTLIAKEDRPLLSEVFNAVQATGVSVEVRASAEQRACEAVQSAAALEAANDAQAQEKSKRKEAQAKAKVERKADAERTLSEWKSHAQTKVVGPKPFNTVYRKLIEHSPNGEKPWLVIGAGQGGAMAAFGDRLMILKVGMLTSFQADSFGGGRITTFHYDQITGIEYNGNIFNGVLEVLTPSYQGTANKDFWKGAFRRPNSDANSPFTLSNTLPLDRFAYQEAIPYLNEIRNKCAEARRPVVHVAVPDTSNGGNGLSAELAKLAELKERGVLDDAEFAAAKQAAILRSSGG